MSFTDLFDFLVVEKNPNSLFTPLSRLTIWVSTSLFVRGCLIGLNHLVFQYSSSVEPIVRVLSFWIEINYLTTSESYVFRLSLFEISWISIKCENTQSGGPRNGSEYLQSLFRKVRRSSLSLSVVKIYVVWYDKDCSGRKPSFVKCFR